ncbi:MAG TPA: malonyl-CoA decarboxylase [Usitatibacteraceae bacterium]|nr:malonyl-CoA decarboxylase [Usitatibacteraceae bacterium]
MPTTRFLIDKLVGTFAAATRSRNERRALRLAKLLHTLISERGESTGAVMARRAVALYGGLDDDGRRLFFDLLARDFSPDPDEVLAAAQAYRMDPSPATLARLQRVTEPPRQEVFRRMNTAPNGTATVVGLRRTLLESLADRPQLAAVDDDLTHLFGSWFNRGFLELRRIDWGTPASILEKLITYEAVHEIQGFPDLKRRLERDRRCFAFFHPALPGEPLVFVEVAFVDEMPSAVAPILAMESAVGDPKKARCAVFYSITSCQPGLKGISFGNFLIKQVAQDLHEELPNLRQFATLSPMPGFRAWLRNQAGQGGLAAAPPIRHAADADPPRPAGDQLREPLQALAAHYLANQWEDGHALDPVARFHLGNGARLERINWLADSSTRGLRQSLGMMVNYVYVLDDVERNHESYVNRHVVACSPAMEKLARLAKGEWPESQPGTPA